MAEYVATKAPRHEGILREYPIFFIELFLIKNIKIHWEYPYYPGDNKHPLITFQKCFRVDLIAFNMFFFKIAETHITPPINAPATPAVNIS